MSVMYLIQIVRDNVVRAKYHDSAKNILLSKEQVDLIEAAINKVTEPKAVDELEYCKMVGYEKKSATARKAAWYVFRTAHNIPFIPGTRSCSRLRVEQAIDWKP